MIISVLLGIERLQVECSIELDGYGWTDLTHVHSWPAPLSPL